MTDRNNAEGNIKPECRSVSTLRGVGETRLAALEKLGIHTLGDLVSFYPRAYQNRGDITSVERVKEKLREKHGEKYIGPYSLLLTVASEPNVKMIRRGMVIMKVRAFDETGSVILTYFNQQYLKNVMHTGAVFRVFGKVCADGGNVVMQSPVTEAYVDGGGLCDIVPVYPLSAGLTQKFISGIIEQAMKAGASNVGEFVPSDALAELSLPTAAYTLKNIHRPESTEAIESARRRLEFDELYLMFLSLAMRSEKIGKKNTLPARDTDITPFLSSVPFELTAAQKRCVGEILGDMSGEKLMNRILTGDVGSGKTVVAAAAVYAAVKNGYRAAVMVPTEILAAQHAEEFSRLLSPLGINCALLTGSTKKKARDMILAGIKDGGDSRVGVDVVIGTQALISDGVEFDSLGLAVIDEQHRFGVGQRAALFEKAENVHCLVMSATPIPRTMTLAILKSIDVSTIDELPSGRQKTDTFIVNEGYRERLNAFIVKQAAEGHQTYVVCPAVEESASEKEEDAEESADIPLVVNDFYSELEEERSASGEKIKLKSAEGMTEYLRDALPELKIGMVHGKMKNAEKDAVMSDFVAGKLDVLVSTTVIEVGVNVPNATLMIVENAERFGLSQLHQLRGRVGRGSAKSYFILVSETTSQTAQARLRAIKSTTDGYKIAEYDLEQRGPGDFFNESGLIRQSGQTGFTLAAACTDKTLIDRAAAYAHRTVESDPHFVKTENRNALLRLETYRSKSDKSMN